MTPKPQPNHLHQPPRDERMRFTPAGAGFCRHCNRFFGLVERQHGRNFEHGYYNDAGAFVVLSIWIAHTKFRCPKCFTRNSFFPADCKPA